MFNFPESSILILDIAVSIKIEKILTNWRS
jgi:hypothetical protein